MTGTITALWIILLLLLMLIQHKMQPCRLTCVVTRVMKTRRQTGLHSLAGPTQTQGPPSTDLQGPRAGLIGADFWKLLWEQNFASFSPSPFLPLSFLSHAGTPSSLYFPFCLAHLSFPSIPSHHALSQGWYGEAISCRSRSGQSPAAK